MKFKNIVFLSIMLNFAQASIFMDVFNNTAHKAVIFVLTGIMTIIELGIWYWLRRKGISLLPNKRS